MRYVVAALLAVGIFLAASSSILAWGLHGNFLIAQKISKSSAPSATLTMHVAPASPSIPATTSTGSIVAALSASWSDSSSFTLGCSAGICGSFMFVSPNYDADLFTVSSSNLTVNANSTGVGSLGNTTQNATMEATMMALTPDGVISNAPSDPPLANSSGVWNWGPSTAGRNTNNQSTLTGDYVLYLNGVVQGSGTTMEVANGGQLYDYSTSAGQWYVFNGSVFVTSGPPSNMYPLQLSGGQILTAGGTQYFALGNGAGYHAIESLPLSGNGGNNQNYYFSNLKASGFNSDIERSMTANNAFDGTPPFNATLAGCTGEQGTTLPCWDLSQPNSTYWAEAHAMVNAANNNGINIFFNTVQGGLPCSGGGTGVQNLKNVGTTVAQNYGTFLGNTFKDLPNIVWYHGDDYECYKDHSYDDVLWAFAQALHTADPTHLQTMEVICDYQNSNDPSNFCNAAFPFDIFPSTLADTTNNWASLVAYNWGYGYSTTWVSAQTAYGQSSTIPIVAGEFDRAGGMTDSNTGSQTGCQNATQVQTAPYCPIRQRTEAWWQATFGAYWGTFPGRDIGNAGGSYVFPSIIPITPDIEARYLANFMRSIKFWTLAPSPGGVSSIVTAGYGSNSTSTSSGTTLGANYVTCSLSSDTKLAICYLPDNNIGPITINMAAMAANVTAKWYDPTADSTVASSYTTVCSPGGTPCGSGSKNFTSPFVHNDGTHDAVLLLTAP